MIKLLVLLALSFSASAFAYPVPDDKFEKLVREVTAYPDPNMREILKENINSVERFEKVEAILDEQLDSESPQWLLAKEKAEFLANSLKKEDLEKVVSKLSIETDATYHEVISLMFAINDQDRPVYDTKDANRENPPMDSKYVIGTEWNRFALRMSALITMADGALALPYTLMELLNRAGMASRAVKENNLSINLGMVSTYAVNASLSFLSQVKMDDTVKMSVTAMLMNRVIYNAAPGAAFLINLLVKDPKSQTGEMANVISEWHLTSVDVRSSCFVLGFTNCRDTKALKTWYEQASVNLQKIGYYPLPPIDFRI